MIHLGISVITVINSVWDITAGHAALLVTKKIIRKHRRGATQCESSRGTNIASWTNHGVVISKKKITLT